MTNGLLIVACGVHQPEGSLLIDRKCYVAGHDAFVVGGTVRDIILGNIPKDVDLITSATLQQVLLQL